MGDLQTQLMLFLHKAAERLRAAELPEELAAQIEQCVAQISQPCVVAVVGPVKAGKSTFINAFLGEDLAITGTTETTATINYFRYGKSDLQHSIRCFWRNGDSRYVDLDFVKNLQGHDLDTLRRADGIDHLEYYLNIPYLEQVTLVDTPGLNAVVTEHQERTAEFLHLEQQLRERHNTETQEIGSKADAVIYLISSTARATDQTFLEEFGRVSQGQQTRAFNAIAVMAKIDLYPEVMERRNELAGKVASQLGESLNTVIPVSAALHHALDHLQENNREGLRHLMEAIRRIPLEQLEKFLADESLYLELNPSDYPISFDQRQALRSTMEWTVFTTIARIAADRRRDIQAVEQALYELAGFDRLNDVLERHFFQRSQLLRCHRILNDVRRVLNKITYTHLPALRRREREEQARQEQFLTFIRQAAPANPQVARDLEALVRTRLTGWAKRIQALLEELGQDFAALSYQFEQYNSDFRALQQLLDNREVFSSAELDELQPLFGLYGLDIEKRLPPHEVTCDYIATRQTYWRAVENRDAHAVRRAIAQQAVSRYSHMQAELSESCR